MNINPVLKKEIITTSRSMKFPVFVLILCILCSVTFLGALGLSDQSLLETRQTYYENDINQRSVNAKTVLDISTSGESVCLVIAFFLAMEFLVMYLVIPSYCASSIAEERQQQTYEMLVTTGYSRRKIIFGKMTSGMVVMFTYIAVALPFLIGLLGMYSVSAKRLFVILVGMIINAYFCAGVGVFAGSKAKHARTSGVLGAAWIIAITFMTILIPAAYYGIKNIYVNYDYFFSSDPKYVDVSIGPIKYLILFNPFLSVCSLIIKSIGINLSIEDLILEIIDYDVTICNKVDNHWTILSLLLLIIMGTVFFLLASVRINPLKKLCRYKKKISSQ